MTKRAEPRRLPRLVWLLVAIVQLVVGVAANLAEARYLVDAELAGGDLHVESEGPRHNPPLHPDDCAVCQYLSSRSTRGESVQFVALPETAGTGNEFPSQRRHHPTGGHTLPPARAPPLR